MRKPGEASGCLEKDACARLNYDATKAQDKFIINRVAEKRGVSMTELSPAWLMTKVTAGGIARLEQPYVPHPPAGMTAQNKHVEPEEIEGSLERWLYLNLSLNRRP